MKNILLYCLEKNDRVNYLLDLLKDEYDISLVFNYEETVKKLDEMFQDLTALIVDNPTKTHYFNDLIQYLNKKNSYMLSVPCIALSDEKHSQDDEQLLSDTVVAIIKDNESKYVISQRIKNSQRFINSVSFQEFSEMLKALPSLIYLKDKDGRYVFCSQYLHHLDNYDDPDWTIRGKTDLDIRKDKENALKAMESDKKVIETGVGTSYIIREEQDNQVEYLQLIKEPVKNKETGEVKGIIAIINNVTVQEELRMELRKKSITDVLTGLYNRVYFVEFAKNRLSDKTVFPVSIISADCDGLKIVNDEYGHLAGDQYICMTANLLKNTLPKGTPIFRMGGDEFLAVLLNTPYEKARSYLDELNKNMPTYKTAHYVLSVSCGLHTMLNNDDETVDSSVNKSDQEMYKAKRKKKVKIDYE